MVLLFHRRWWMGNQLDHAYLAVDFFFLLSGFVIPYAYENKLLTRMSLGEFVNVRALRLYPLLILGAALGAIAVAIDPSTAGQSLVGKLSVLFVFAAAALPAPPLLAHMPFSLNGPRWSLFFELAINLAYGLFVTRLTNRRLTWFVALSAIAYVAVGVHYHGIGVGFHYRSIPAGFARVAFPFSLGVLMYRKRDALPRISAPFWLLCLMLTATFLPPRWGADYDLPVAMLLYPAIVMLALNREPSARETRFAAWSGFISYPLYILHYPLWSIYETVLSPHLPQFLWLPLGAAMIVLVCHCAGLLDQQFRATVARQPLRAVH